MAARSTHRMHWLAASGAAVALATLAALAGCGRNPIGPGRPSSNYLSLHDYELTLPDTLVDTSGAHDIRITRIFQNGTEERLLRTVESIYPPSARAVDDSGRVVDRWWFTTFDGILVDNLPTRGALEYYLATIRRFQAGDFTGTIRMQSSGLDYTSTIAWERTATVDGVAYRGVYVAEIHIAWYQVCGNLCAMGFDRKRTAVLDSRGTILRLIDPKYIIYWVS